MRDVCARPRGISNTKPELFWAVFVYNWTSALGQNPFLEAESCQSIDPMLYVDELCYS